MVDNNGAINYSDIQKSNCENLVEIQVFPNPSNGQFYLELPLDLKEVQVEVKDVLGRDVLVDFKKENGLLVVDLKVVKGVYFLHIFDDEVLIGRAEVVVLD